jgi:hypothetical protein
MERDSQQLYGNNLCKRSARDWKRDWIRWLYAICHFHYLRDVCAPYSHHNSLANHDKSVYTVILTNKLTKNIPAQVPPAVVAAGLPSSSVLSYMVALTTGNATALQAVPGISPSIIAAGTGAYKNASTDAYRTVFYSTIAFSAVGVIISFFLPNIDNLLTGEVSTTLHGKEDQIVGATGTEKTAEVIA